MKVEFTAGPDDHDRRLETVIRKRWPGWSLGKVHKALRQGDLRLNGYKVGADARVAEGDTLSVWQGLLDQDLPETSAPPIPDDWVIYQGPDLLVINKPSGLVVHRGDGPTRESAPLDDRVRAWLGPSSTPSLGFRSGPLHRLDRETSGLIVFSRSLVGARSFSQAVAEREVEKTYLALLEGSLIEAKEVRVPLARNEAEKRTEGAPDGQEALTRFRPLAHSPGYTLAEVDLGTGRTHQIRAHARELSHPLAGDEKYGGHAPPAGLGVPWLLHAWKLSCRLLPPLRAPLSEQSQKWVEKTFKIRV